MAGAKPVQVDMAYLLTEKVIGMGSPTWLKLHDPKKAMRNLNVNSHNITLQIPCLNQSMSIVSIDFSEHILPVS